MLKTIFWVSWMFLYFFCRLPTYFKVKRLRENGRADEAQAIIDYEVKKWAGLLLRHIGTTVVETGRENLPSAGEAVVFAANHQSYVDIPVLLANLDFPHPLLAKTALGKVPLLSLWMNVLGCFYVDRDDVRASAKALKEGEELLRSGRSVVVFPEGTRSQSDQMGEFKAGAVRMAFKTGAKIVPVAIDGSYSSLEGNRWKLQKNTVRLTILPPVETAGLAKEQQRELPGQLEKMIEQAKNDRIE